VAAACLVWTSGSYLEIVGRVMVTAAGPGSSRLLPQSRSWPSCQGEGRGRLRGQGGRTPASRQAQDQSSDVETVRPTVCHRGASPGNQPHESGWYGVDRPTRAPVLNSPNVTGQVGVKRPGPIPKPQAARSSRAGGAAFAQLTGGFLLRSRCRQTPVWQSLGNQRLAVCSSCLWRVAGSGFEPRVLRVMRFGFDQSVPYAGVSRRDRS
jgi:hypothetical protein